MCFSLTGCFTSIYTRTATNDLPDVCQECKKVNEIDELVDNIKIMMNKVQVMGGEYLLSNTKHTYEITFEAITKDKKLNWDLYATANYNDKEVNIYFKNSKFYIIYPHNSANVIIKDKLENLVVEVEDTLDNLNATYSKDNLDELVLGSKLSGYHFEAMRENGTFTKNNDGSYLIKFHENELEYEYEITSNYLVKESRCKAINFDSVFTFEYPKEVSITYPMGLDFLTTNIKEVKGVLEIDSFAELLDESLKNKDKGK